VAVVVGRRRVQRELGMGATRGEKRNKRRGKKESGRDREYAHARESVGEIERASNVCLCLSVCVCVCVCV
jgi:hypothetical protein